MKFAGVTIKIERTAYYGFGLLVLIPLLVISAYMIFIAAGLSWRAVISAAAVGICFGLYHQIAQFVHQMGHAFAARAVGFPMMGIRYEYIFSYSEYPPNEPVLPARIHIIRSLGGAVATTMVLIIGVLLWSQVQATDEFTRWLLNFILFDSIVLFIGGVIISDGLFFILQKDWEQPETSTGSQNS